MPISRGWRLGNFLNVVINGISHVITAGRNSPSVRALEEPAMLVVTPDFKTTLMHQFVGARPAREA